MSAVSVEYRLSARTADLRTPVMRGSEGTVNAGRRHCREGPAGRLGGWREGVLGARVMAPLLGMLAGRSVPRTTRHGPGTGGRPAPFALFQANCSVNRPQPGQGWRVRLLRDRRNLAALADSPGGQPGRVPGPAWRLSPGRQAGHPRPGRTPGGKVRGPGCAIQVSMGQGMRGAAPAWLMHLGT